MAAQHGHSVEEYLTRPENLIILFELERKLPGLRKTRSPDAPDAQAEFLMQPANFATAEEMLRYLAPIKNGLIKLFWGELGEEILKLSRDAAYDGWELSIPSEEQRLRPYEGCKLFPPAKPGAPILYPEFSQTTINFNFGITRSEVKNARPEFWTLPGVTYVHSRLVKDRFRKNSPWWLGYKTAASLEDELFWLSLAGERNSFIKQLAEAFWQLFLSCKEALEAANQELAEKSQQTSNEK
jgi:hypothetical protein